MEKNVIALKTKIKEVSDNLEDFLKSIDKDYKENIRVLEATAQKYTDAILDGKKDLEKLVAEQDKVIKEISDKKKKFADEIAQREANFDRTIKGEADRMDKENKDIDTRGQGIDKLIAETKQLNGEAKARDSESLDNFQKADKALTEANKLKLEYEGLLADVNKKELELNRKLQKIEPELKAIEEANANISLQEIAITKGNKDNAKKQSEIDQKEADVIAREKSVSKRELVAEKKERDFIKREEDIEKKEHENTVMRSDLQTGHDNLKKLQEEFNQKIKK